MKLLLSHLIAIGTVIGLYSLQPTIAAWGAANILLTAVGGTLALVLVAFAIGCLCASYSEDMSRWGVKQYRSRMSLKS